MIFKINKEYSKSTKASRNIEKKLHDQKKLALGENPATFICQTVYNFSSYHPTTEDVKALTFGLDVNTRQVEIIINFLPSLKNFIKTF